MLLDLPLQRTSAPAAWTVPTTWLARLSSWRRASRARQAAASRLSRTDAATGLVERRVATLWLHASAGTAARRGEKLAIAVVRADQAPPAEVAQAIAKALPVGGMGARWERGAYLVAAPGAEGATLWLALRGELARAGIVAEVGWASGTDPDAMIARATEGDRVAA